MKYSYFSPLLIPIFFLFSCNNNEERIQQLVKENKMLRDSLKSSIKTIVSSDFILYPQPLSFKLNQPNTISCYISEQKDLPAFNVYLADENYKFDESDKIKLKNKSKNKFEFDYTPKTVNEGDVRIVAVFNLDTVKVNLNGRTYLPVK